MTKDYRRRANPSEKPKKEPVPAWVPFFYGSLFGATSVAIGWLLFTPLGTPLVMPDFSSAKNVEGQVAKTEVSKPSEPERPRFDFYTILPEMEVVISDEEAAPPPLEEKAISTNQESSKVSYRLQVGSFKKPSDADRQKARLALLGVEAVIQKVNVGAGEVYHRVLTKPFSSKKELNAKRKMFQENRINSLVVQIKN